MVHSEGIHRFASVILERSAADRVTAPAAATAEIRRKKFIFSSFVKKRDFPRNLFLSQEYILKIAHLQRFVKPQRSGQFRKPETVYTGQVIPFFLKRAVKREFLLINH